LAVRWKPLLLPVVPAALWWLLSGGEPTSWVIGLPAVVLAGWAFGRLQIGPTEAVSASGMLAFAPFFIWESLRGGLDVSVRTLAPRMHIRPALAVYRIALRRQDARRFFTNCVSLLPGTLAANLAGDRLGVHVLDADTDWKADLQRLERAVARIFPQTQLDVRRAR